MQDIDELQREAHRLGEQVRAQRAGGAHTRRTDLPTLHALQDRLTAVWSEIRARRAGSLIGAGGGTTEPERRTRPKWL